MSIERFLHTSEFLGFHRRILSGDSDAWTQLFSRIQVIFEAALKAQTIKYSCIRPWVDTDDLIQMARIKLISSFKSRQPKDIRDLQNWISRIFRNTLIDQIRKYYGPEGLARNSVRFSDLNNDSNEDSQSSVIDHPDEQSSPSSLADWTRIHILAQKLPEPQKTVFEKRYYENWTHAKIAELLEVHEITAIRYWTEARLLLKAKWSSDSDE